MQTVETLTLPIGQQPDEPGWQIESSDAKTSRWVRLVRDTPARRQPEPFLSNSGRTVGTLDRTGMQKLAEEHEWMRDRIARLELDNSRLAKFTNMQPDTQPTNLSALSLGELAALFEAYTMASDTMLGVQNQPRVKDGGQAFLMLDGEAGRNDRCARVMADEARRRRPASHHEAAIRARLLAGVALASDEFQEAIAALTEATQPVACFEAATA